MSDVAGLEAALSRFGASVKAKLSGHAISGEPEDQLRAPLEALIADLAALLHRRPGQVTAIGEARIAALQTRPDYAIRALGALVGFIEVKAPGKGADPRRFRDAHDKAQWEKLRYLPNLIYTDGQHFTLWRDGALHGEPVALMGDIETSGAALRAPPALLTLFAAFLEWSPIPPRNAAELAKMTAGLCRLLREEVAEQLRLENPTFTGLKQDWRKLLFPEATDEQFADGYAQAVTFGLLMARSQDIKLADGLDRVAKRLSRTDTLIGRAFQVLTSDDDEADGIGDGPHALRTSLDTLKRVLDAVDWASVSKGDPEAWLYFYENFLDAYDSDLRRRTGSYYTPPEVVAAMVRLVDEVLRDASRFNLPQGLGAREVTLADPAMGTGTYLLGVLRHIAAQVAADGPGAVRAAVETALPRMIGFELQFGPFAVAQLRLIAEVTALLNLDAAPPAALKPRLYVTNTLGNPNAEEEYIPQMLATLAEHRRDANRIKRGEPITVVIGNPPYKEHAKGKGGWVESGSENVKAPLARWYPPPAWGVGAHAKHLRNLYVYFWRWATWKVFGDAAEAAQAATGRRGVVCFITVAGFLNGRGFEQMRADMRATADDIWVLDCSPEGHQPETATRIFQGVQQPVCIVLMARGRGKRGGAARVRYRALPEGRREQKFEALARLGLEDDGWIECPPQQRAPFLPRLGAGWGDYPALSEIFDYNGSGVMPGRVWIIAPDQKSLDHRWDALIKEKDPTRKEVLFHPHGSVDNPGDRHTQRVVETGLPGQPRRNTIIALDSEPALQPVRYGFRSFDRQWIIPDNRLINRANPTLWSRHSDQQVYLTALMAHAPSNGPALTFTGLIPDLHHYKGSFGGRAFPLWADAAATTPNIAPHLLALLQDSLQIRVTAPDVLAYLAAIAAHPAYTARFLPDLVQPGLRIPLTADAALFTRATSLGRRVIWLHCFGERFADAAEGRPAGPPRLPEGARPTIPADGAIPTARGRMPDALRHDAAARRLHVGEGHIDNVPAAVARYEVSGKNVLEQWFSYRGRDRSRPIIGERRKPSPLGDIQPDAWLAEYTTELLNVLNVLGGLVALEPEQASLLDAVCAGPLIDAAALGAAGRTLRERGAVPGQERLL